MKKLLLLALVGLAAGAALLAQDATAPALKVSGSLSFGIGDKDAGDSNTDTPAFAPFESKSATATITAASADEKVSATVDLDLMAAATAVTKTAFNASAMTANPLAKPAYDADPTEYSAYLPWAELKELKDWYNGRDDADIIDSGTKIWVEADITALIATLKGTVGTESYNFDNGSTSSEIKLIDDSGFTVAAIQDGGTLEHIGVLVDATFTGTFQVALGTAVNNAVAKILETATHADLKAIDDGSELTTFINAALTGLSNPTTPTQYDVFVKLTADDRNRLEEAADLWYSFLAVGQLGLLTANDMTLEGTTTLTQNILKSATIKFNKVFGILDIAYLYGGQHVSAGSINADSSGHQSDAVSAYSGLTLGLASDVVAGLSAGLGLFIDSNGVAAAVSDTWHTLFDEAASEDVPVWGLEVGGGYTAALGDISVGAKAEFGLYNLLGGSPAWALSVMPSFSGFGASVNAEFAYGLGGLMYLKAGASYSIMGITPSATFHMVKPGESGKNLAYAGTPTSVLGDVKAGDGMAIEGGLSVNVATLAGGNLPLGLTPTVNGGLVVGLVTDEDAQIGWNAGLSVGLLDMLTIAAGLSSDPVGNEGTTDAGETLDWNASVALKYAIATLKLGVSSAYSAADDRSKVGWSLTGSVSF